MAILSDIPIQQYTIPEGETSLQVDIPELVLPGSWSRTYLILTNNYIDETYPLTNSDNILEFNLTLIKGSTPVHGVMATMAGGQSLDLAGNPRPKVLRLTRPEGTTGSLKVTGFVKMFTDLEIGARIETE